MVKFYLTCNWDTNENITQYWDKKLDKKTFPEIEFTNNRDESDYYLVFNKPFIQEGDFDFMNDKTILIRMEPFMEENIHLWGDWSRPDYTKFKKVIMPPNSLNFVEWHLDKTYDELVEAEFEEKTMGNTISVIISDKYQDEGQIKRIEFIKYLQENYEGKIELDIYGKGNLSRWGIKNHKGELPLYKKDEGILPYKYHFNCENSYKLNYITEKFYDGVLGNAFMFYSGAFNANSVFPYGGFEFLDLDDFKTSAKQMYNCIKNNRYELDKEKVQKLKKSILENGTISKRLHEIVMNDNEQVVFYSYKELLEKFNDICESRHAKVDEEEEDVKEKVKEEVKEEVKEKVTVEDNQDIRMILVRLITSIDNLTNAINHQNRRQ